MLVHGLPRVYWDDSFRRKPAVAQDAVRSGNVAVSSPLFDGDSPLFETVEGLPIEAVRS